MQKVNHDWTHGKQKVLHCSHVYPFCSYRCIQISLYISIFYIMQTGHTHTHTHTAHPFCYLPQPLSSQQNPEWQACSCGSHTLFPLAPPLSSAEHPFALLSGTLRIKRWSGKEESCCHNWLSSVHVFSGLEWRRYQEECCCYLWLSRWLQKVGVTLEVWLPVWGEEKTTTVTA